MNLTRFSLFFPEKREFFLENQGVFNTGPPIPFLNNRGTLQDQGPPDIIPFFSRTIGLDSETGQPIPILGGIRLSGKIGRNNLGLLNIQSDAQDSGSAASRKPRSNFSVLRYSREVLSNSAIGVVYLGKEQGNSSNRIFGSDLTLNFLRKLDVDGLWLRSVTAGQGAGQAWRAGFTYNSELMTYQASFLSLSPHFHDELGFIPRHGVDIFSGHVARHIRPAAYRIIREYRPDVASARFMRRGVGVETNTISPTLNIDFADGSLVLLTYRASEEVLTKQFPIRANYSIAPGRYNFQDWSAEFQAGGARLLSPNAGYRRGGFWNGQKQGFIAGARVRISAKLATSLNFSRDLVDLPGQSFSTNLVSLRIDNSFSTRMALNAFIQYNSVRKEIVSNVRFNFIHHPLSDLFIVYNETRPTVGTVSPSRALILKVTHLLSF